MSHVQTWELDEPWHVFQFCIEQLWSSSGSRWSESSSSCSGFKERHCGLKKKKGLFCCSGVSSDTYSDKLCVCESWCRLHVIMLESSLPRPTVVFLTSSAPRRREFPCGEPSRQILLLRKPFFYGSLFFFVSSINPCSLSLSLHIALRLICLVLAQCAMKLPLQCSLYVTQRSAIRDAELLLVPVNQTEKDRLWRNVMTTDFTQTGLPFFTDAVKGRVHPKMEVQLYLLTLIAYWKSGEVS